MLVLFAMQVAPVGLVAPLSIVIAGLLAWRLLAKRSRCGG